MGTARVRRLAALWLGTALWAQPPTFRTTVPEVQVPVTVTGSKGSYEAGLAGSDFRLYDNGVEQSFRLLSSDDLTTPIALVVAVQMNDIAQPALLKIRRTGSLIEPLITGSRGHAAVLTYSGSVRLVQDFTRQGEELIDAFRGLRPDDYRDAHLLDALDSALDMLSRRPRGERRIVLFLGESRDRGSAAKMEDLLPRLQREDVTVYAGSYSAYRTAFTTRGSEYRPPATGPDYIGAIVELTRLGKSNHADLLTAQTGGRKFSFGTLRGLESLLAKLGEELHSQYLLSYAPSSPAPGFHTIEVRLPGRPKLKLQFRPGYWVGEPE